MPVCSCVLTANAGPDQTVEQTSPSGASVTLNGLGSTQSGLCAEEMTYTWSWPDGSATGVNPTVLMTLGPKNVKLTLASGAELANDEATYTVGYGFSGFLEPISLGKLFKLGSTIPVKFRLMDGAGNYVSTAIATIAVQQFTGDDPIGDPIILSANGADSGNTFRYDAAGSQYIYNLGTKDLYQGTWQIRVTLDDGTVKSVDIQLKKN